ncbi:MAG: hypothetical protein A2494_00670 [Candidatus Lloydbacteria bacterium RIFOXYC12_FULL_46_25]|uniref:DUF805 domain-containing protein n=1 Tax=Candidatus Lloydbacteria bacterium RIFOXYC12_FULL_46_25 TaxID=1798670 RepID=A0A1G2E087_9BACT|nr:MAG: hypothetical protein A2494_00670 [Candidatus Lloydbacteria bacterium RIFOXYC12_FULL_46_25]
MINPQIAKYINDERARGVIDADIKKALIEKGWQENDVENAFKAQVAIAHVGGLFKGRLDKGNFLKIALAAIALQFLFMFFGAGSMMGMMPGYGSSLFGGTNLGIAIIGLLVMVVMGLVVAVYELGATVRRLHDLGQTGWYALGLALVGMVPFIGWIISIGALIYLSITPGDPAENTYGGVPNPHVTLWQAIKGSE